MNKFSFTGQDDFDWEIGRGRYPSQFDHTTGNANGSFLFIETSYPRKEGDIVNKNLTKLNKSLINNYYYILKGYFVKYYI
jgi:hypothetical protein